MNKNTHWKVAYDPSYGEYYVVEGNSEVKKTKANAELQSAAPELLEALERLRNAEKAPREEWLAALENADKALSKAKGETP